jgi:hypothetical protein
LERGYYFKRELRPLSLAHSPGEKTSLDPSFPKGKLGRGIKRRDKQEMR